MIIYKSGDLLKSETQTHVNTVNCVGAMGKGIALQFKKAYPEMFKVYKKTCNNGMLRPGMLQLWKGDKVWVLNFPTKDHWRNRSELSYIEEGLQKFVASYKAKGIQSIAFPKLGCNNGGLDWERQVKGLMEHYLKDLDILVEIYV